MSLMPSSTSTVHGGNDPTRPSRVILSMVAIRETLTMDSLARPLSRGRISRIPFVA